MGHSLRDRMGILLLVPHDGQRVKTLGLNGTSLPVPYTPINGMPQLGQTLEKGRGFVIRISLRGWYLVGIVPIHSNGM